MQSEPYELVETSDIKQEKKTLIRPVDSAIKIDFHVTSRGCDAEESVETIEND